MLKSSHLDDRVYTSHDGTQSSLPTSPSSTLVTGWLLGEEPSGLEALALDRSSLPLGE